MIYGIGTDIVQITRLEQSYDRFGKRFAQRILGSVEMQVFEQRLSQHKKRGIRFLATRFAVKEAFAKALGLGIRELMDWHALEVLNNDKGQPYACLHGRLKEWAYQNDVRTHVSLSDEAEYAIAYVTLETNG